MKATPTMLSRALPPLLLAWLGLVMLTVLGLGLGRWTDHAAWLQLALAVIVWLKGTIVARYFLESHLAHPLIAGIVQVFIAGVPLALLLTAWL